MDYNSGRMGMAEGIALALIVTFPTVFLSEPTLMVHGAGSLGWACPLIGGFVGGLLIIMLTYVFTRYRGDLVSVSEKLLGKPLSYIIGIYYFSLLLGFAILWTRKFAENTLLTALSYAEFNVVAICYIVSAGIFIYAGIEAICRATYIILPFCITGMLLVFAGLIPVYKPYYLFPWQGNGLSSVINPVLITIGLSGPLSIIPVLAQAFQNIQTIRAAVVFGYGLSMVIRSLTIAVFVMVFGVNVAVEKTLPFYEMARLIYINRYLQRFEALFTLLWVMVGILAIALSLYGAMYIAAKLFKLPTIKPLLPAMVIIVAQIAALPANLQSVSAIEAIMYPYIFAPGIIIIPSVLLIATIIKGGEKPCHRV